MSGDHVPSSRAVDASMDLLLQIIRQPVDPDYALVSQRGSRPVPARWWLALVAVVIGAMFAVSALQTTRAAPALAAERSELIRSVSQAEVEQDELRRQLSTLSADIDRLTTAALGTDDQAATLETQIAVLGPEVGQVGVAGPGLVITVDDAPAAAAEPAPGTGAAAGGSERDRVLDLDLQVMVNGLWQAGAEAVAINGHRLSTLTAIRGAGDAITVDYRSLTRPYRVEAIGNARTLPARFAETAGGLWWTDLAQNRRLRYEVAGAESLRLPADPGMALRYARKAAS